MARVQNTLIGRASGSVGEVVFLTWRLINVTRAKPETVGNPNTILQQQQRNRFGATVELYRILKDVISVGLKNRNRKMTLFNFFQYLNQQSCFSNVGDGSVTFLPENLKLSYGLAQKPFVIGINAIYSVTNVSFTMGSIPYPEVGWDNQYFIAIFNITKGTYVLSMGQFVQDQSNFNINMNETIGMGSIVYAYIFVYNPLTKEVSDTVVSLVNVTS